MSDPVSIATSIASLVGTSYKISKSIYGAVDALKSAPKHIKAISADTKAMFSVLGTLAAYLDDEDSASGVVHHIVADDLAEVLRNTISVLKELRAIVNEVVQEDIAGRGELGSRSILRWNLREPEIRKWREQLAAHKITLNVAVAMANCVNTRSTEIATLRVEKEVIELRTKVTELLVRMNAAEETYADRGVVIDNYNAAMRRIARGADSIVSDMETTWQRPPSPSLVVSSAGVTEHSDTSYRTARSTMTRLTRLTRLTVRPTVPTESLLGSGPEPQVPHGIVSRGDVQPRSISKPADGSGRLQFFVKGPDNMTRPMTFDCAPCKDELLAELCNRAELGPGILHRLSVRVNGRVIVSDGATLHDIVSGSTIHVNVIANGLGWKSWSFDDDDGNDEWYAESLETLGSLQRFASPFLGEGKLVVYRARYMMDGSFGLSVDWHGKGERETQRRYGVYFSNLLRKVLGEALTTRRSVSAPRIEVYDSDELET